MFDVTLTFDNGPTPGVTSMVLDTLAAAGILSTFFVVGEKAAADGLRLCERAHAEGHWIGNHTWTHPTLFGDREEADVAELEIGRTQRLIGSLAHPDRYFRPPADGGHLDRRLLSPIVLRYLKEGHYTCVLWNAIPRDWAEPDQWVETAFDQCLSRTWSLVVLHDTPTGAMRHLPRFIDRVTAAGGRFRQDFPQDCITMFRGRALSEGE